MPKIKTAFSSLKIDLLNRWLVYLFSNFFGMQYNHGYTAALLDIERILTDDGFLLDLKKHKKTMTRKNLLNLIKCLQEGRAILRENPDAWVRCNNKAKYGFEICIGNLKDGGYVYQPKK